MKRVVIIGLGILMLTLACSFISEAIAQDNFGDNGNLGNIPPGVFLSGNTSSKDMVGVNLAAIKVPSRKRSSATYTMPTTIESQITTLSALRYKFRTKKYPRSTMQRIFKKYYNKEVSARTTKRIKTVLTAVESKTPMSSYEQKALIQKTASKFIDGYVRKGKSEYLAALVQMLTCKGVEKGKDYNYDLLRTQVLTSVAEKASSTSSKRMARVLDIVGAGIDSSQVYTNYGFIKSYTNQNQQAISLLEKAIELDPQNAEAYFYLGRSHNDPQKEAECYKKSLSLNPDNASVCFNLASLYKREKQYQPAIVYYKKAIAINPKKADAYSDLGIVYKKLNDLDQAIVYYQKSIEADPDYTVAYYNLALLYKQLGKYAKANALLDQIKQIYAKGKGKQHPLILRQFKLFEGIMKKQKEFNTYMVHVSLE